MISSFLETDIRQIINPVTVRFSKGNSAIVISWIGSMSPEPRSEFVADGEIFFKNASFIIKVIYRFGI